MDMCDLVCVNCGQNEHLEDAVYCQKCGVNLLNYCSNKNCEIYGQEFPFLPRNALYCPYCGEKTTYYDYLNKSKD